VLQRLEERALPADPPVRVDDRREAGVGRAHERDAVLDRAERRMREVLLRRRTSGRTMRRS
jgi:hypothetical protein